MKFLKFSLLVFFVSLNSYSQVGINTTSPDKSSILDVVATDKGLLIPRVALINNTDITTIVDPAIGLLVYKTGPSTLMPNGFYYWDSTMWQPLDRGESKESWLVDGNNIADDTKFIGTLNNLPLNLRVNDNQVASFYPEGGFALGYNATANTTSGISLGQSSNASGLNNIAIGLGSYSANSNSSSMGTYAVASGDYGVAIGTQAKAEALNTTAIGHQAEAKKSISLAIGAGSKAMEEASLAVGAFSKAEAYKSFALGPNSTASAENAFAVGVGSIANMPNTIILGEVQLPGNPAVTPANVGIGTVDPKARLDVHGDFKLGSKGSVYKGVSSFEYLHTINSNITAGGSVVIEVAIPTQLQLQAGNYKATITATLGQNMPDALAISWAKLGSGNNNTIRLKIKNEATSDVSFPSNRRVYFTIHEF